LNRVRSPLKLLIEASPGLVDISSASIEIRGRRCRMSKRGQKALSEDFRREAVRRAAATLDDERLVMVHDRACDSAELRDLPDTFESYLPPEH
jgi:hypothetical protein